MILQSRSERYFADLEENLTTFYRKVQDLKHLKVLTEEDFSKEEGYAFDPTKSSFIRGNTDMTGKELMDILRKDWDMELEMASGYYALALTGIMDTEDGFFSLSEALHTIDEQMKKTGKDVAVEESIKIEDENEHVSYLFMQELYGKKEVVYPVWGSRGHEKNGDLFRKCIRKDQCGNGQPVSAGNPAPASGRTDREWIFRRNRKMPGKRTAYQRIVRGHQMNG